MDQSTAIHASFAKTHDLSLLILETLTAQSCPVGYGLAACGLTMARLLNPTTRLSDEEEIKFVEDVMAFGGAYWGEGNGKVMS